MFKEQESILLPQLEKNHYHGLFIDIEGLDGSGQSTRIENLKDFFTKNSLDFITTKEPNEDSYLGKEIRQILRGEKKINDPLEFQKMYIANRRDHLDKLVIPNLKKGKIVLTDRYFWSTVAYGSINVDPVMLLEMNQRFISPDITYFINTSPEECMRRMEASRDSLEFFEKKEKLEKVSKTYNWLANNYKNHILSINGYQEKEIIHSQINNHLNKQTKFISILKNN